MSISFEGCKELLDERRQPPVNYTSPMHELSTAILKPISDFEMKPAEWLVDGWIPRGAITTWGADGGEGKSTTWQHTIAALTSGRPTIFDSPDVKRPPKRVAIFTAEDSVRVVVRKRLIDAGADESMISALDLSDPSSTGVTLGSDALLRIIADARPDLAIFDPLEGFLARDVNMAARNQMRGALAPLIGLGEKYGTTFLIIAHSNKRSGVGGRARLSDSSDLWDASRSVIMMGKSDEHRKYISHEKSNYGDLQPTLITEYNRRENKISVVERSQKRDADFQSDSTYRPAPKRDECAEWILAKLDETMTGKIPSKRLDEMGQRDGFSAKTIRNAKEHLRDSGQIKIKSDGFDQKAWFIVRT